MSVRCSARRLVVAAGVLVLGVTGGLGPLQRRGRQPEPRGDVVQTPLPVRNGMRWTWGSSARSRRFGWPLASSRPTRWQRSSFFRRSRPSHPRSSITTRASGVTRGLARLPNSSPRWWPRPGLRSQGDACTDTCGHLSGSVANVQRLFGVQIDTYRLGSKTFFANNANPVLPRPCRGSSSRSTASAACRRCSRPRPGTRSRPARRLPARRSSSGAHASKQQPRKAARGVRAARRTRITDARMTRPTSTARRRTTPTRSTTRATAATRPGNSVSSPTQTSIAIARSVRRPAATCRLPDPVPVPGLPFHEVNIDGTPACCDAEGTMDLEWSTAMSNSFGSFQDTSTCRSTTAPTSTTRPSPTCTTRWSPTTTLGLQHQLELHRVYGCSLQRR